MSTSSEPRFDYPNNSIERTVRARWMEVMVSVETITGFLGGIAILHLTKGYPLVPTAPDLFVLLPALLVATLGISWIGTRGTIMLLVPRAIAIENDRIVGDFRRKGWKGHPVRQIMFENVSGFGKERLIRIGVVRARPDRTLRDLTQSTTCMYLSESNLARVRSAYEENRCANQHATGPLMSEARGR